MIKLDWKNIFTSRIFWIIIACIVGLGLLLYLITSVKSCQSQRTIDKMKANINAIGKEIANAQTDQSQANANLAAAKQKLADETNSYLQAVNASDAGKLEIQKAQTNLNAAINGNLPVNTTADDLQKRLEDLDR